MCSRQNVILNGSLLSETRKEHLPTDKLEGIFIVAKFQQMLQPPIPLAMNLMNNRTPVHS